jgi:hypothetical protein
MVSFKPRPLYSQGKSPFYPLVRRLGEPLMEHLREDGKIILQLILGEKFEKSWTSFIWLKIETSSGPL